MVHGIYNEDLSRWTEATIRMIVSGSEGIMVVIPEFGPFLFPGGPPRGLMREAARVIPGSSSSDRISLRRASRPPRCPSGTCRNAPSRSLRPGCRAGSRARLWAASLGGTRPEATRVTTPARPRAPSGSAGRRSDVPLPDSVPGDRNGSGRVAGARR